MRYEYCFPPSPTNSWHPPFDFGIFRIRLHFSLLMPKYYYQFELKICFRFLKLFVIYVWCTTCKQAEVLFCYVFCYMHSTANTHDTVCFRIVKMNKLLMGFQCKLKWKFIRSSAFDDEICIFTCFLLWKCVGLIFRTMSWITSPSLVSLIEEKKTVFCIHRLNYASQNRRQLIIPILSHK